MLLKETGIPQEELTEYEKKHILDSESILRWFPRKYLDYRTVKNITECGDGEYAAVYGKMVKAPEVKKSESGQKYLRLLFICPSNTAKGVTFFRSDFFVRDYAGYLERVYSSYTGKNVIITGKISVHPVYGYSIQETKVYMPDEFVPGIYTVYPKLGGLSEDTFRTHVKYFYDMCGEILEEDIRNRYGIPPYREAVRKIHYPQSPDEIEQARQQFIFYDLLWFCMKQKAMSKRMSDTSSAVMQDGTLLNRFAKDLPYPLTRLSEEDIQKNRERQIKGFAQWEAVSAMIGTMASGKRLNVLVEGDVGCGKTVIAACMIMFAAGNGYQSVMVAPKTVLARQHYEEIKGYCDSLGLKCVFLSGAPKNARERKQREEALESIKDGTAAVIIGTHSCFSRAIEYNKLGLIIYDEEQSFGAEQKIALYDKAVPGVHTIEMSATPVPRSLALSIYGNKDVIRITKKPAGREKIQTVPFTEADRERAYAFIEGQLAQGRQCYVVAPAIEDNEDFGLIGADTVAKRYKKRFEKRGYKVVTANGRMTDEEFTKAIDKFKSCKAHIFVATTIIEVGVNIPNATVIVIEQAERFGLSQLHQLRGRVGRREYKSCCILMTEDPENPRIKAVSAISDGFEIAEEDYRLRGPGDVHGKEQSGENVYIDEILSFPQIYVQAKEAADIIDRKPMSGTYFRNYSMKVTNEQRGADEENV